MAGDTLPPPAGQGRRAYIVQGKPVMSPSLQDAPNDEQADQSVGVEIAEALTIILMQARALQVDEGGARSPPLADAATSIDRAARRIWGALADLDILPSRAIDPAPAEHPANQGRD